MVNEVNKLIFNTLTEGGAIYIADKGTISIERTSARALRRGRVVSPTYNVSFSTGCSAPSLSSVICSVANISNDDAEDIARRWLDKVTEDDRVVIEGVGTIVNGSFVADKALIETLAQCNKTIEITRTKSKRRWPWMLLILCLIIGASAAAYYFYGDTLFKNQTAIIEDVTNIVAPEDNVEQRDTVSSINTLTQEAEIVDEIGDSTVDSTHVESAPIVAQEPKAENAVNEVAQQQDVDLSDWRNQAVRHYVIFGSYSNTANANKAIRKILRRNPAAQCQIIPLGGLHAVAVYGSYNRNECEAFKRQHRSIYKDAWVHTPKRFR